MKISVLLSALLFVGCQAVRPPAKPVADPLPLHGKPDDYVSRPLEMPLAPSDAAPKIESERFTRQLQFIESLLAQNDALSARLRAAEQKSAASASPNSVVPAAENTPKPAAVDAAPSPATKADPSAVSHAAESPSSEFASLVPNADGVIDLGAVEAAANNGNPFAVRRVTDDRAATVLAVEGIVLGGHPCALINEHVVEPGEAVANWRLTALEGDAVVLTDDSRKLNLTVTEKAVRILR